MIRDMIRKTSSWRFSLFLPLLVITSWLVSCGPSFEVYDLRCEGLTEPLGIDSAEPHLSWKIRSAKPMEQVAYEIRMASAKDLLKAGKADLWNTGKVTSSDQVMVPYSGTPLSSRQQCWWQVRVCPAAVWNRHYRGRHDGWKIHRGDICARKRATCAQVIRYRELTVSSSLICQFVGLP